MTLPIFAVHFEDYPGHEATRVRHMEAHLGFLDARPAITVAGPLSDDAGAPAGGLWLVAAPDPGDVTQLVEADPFRPTGLASFGPRLPLAQGPFRWAAALSRAARQGLTAPLRPMPTRPALMSR